MHQYFTPQIIAEWSPKTQALSKIIAEMVCEEVERYTGQTLDRNLISKLAQRARDVYANNRPLRLRLNGKGNTGRDILYSFMRHWLSAELIDTNAEVWGLIKNTGFSNGEALA
jgi:hypothetical protein